ncbi:1-acyl-sn-glycerol-3-phosphate acyltransferase [Variovorax sp. OV329]|uniref:1-acyl-sn-glycerol-3-phosphate acyltransferase n=1 Tax=Variovorax sp. OV329 TaxID=1882825 RepID=UPI0008E4B153|nr:1-acyl-sn-glycerol-3-phosphate acyltransferase [Variovorax sp. OV329]SFM94504.1 1-acyl-sn-glycerol-3-phosphate acyltransferases [Variovorax sp. OV329]
MIDRISSVPLAAVSGSSVLCASLVCVWRFRLNFLHAVVRLVVRAAYRIRLVNVQHIPTQGGALLVCNHVSYLDAFVIGASSPRPLRFVMSNRIYRNPLGHWFFRFTRAIPVASGARDADLLASAYDECARSLEAGELICLFPEGRRSATGAISRFQPGVREILRRVPVPVVPMALQGLWGSCFSRDTSARVPRPMRNGSRSRITVSVGTPVAPHAASPSHLQKIVEHLHMTTSLEGT